MSTDSDYADAVSRILLQKGQAQAQGKLGAGQAWGHFAGQLGQIAQNVGQQYQDRQAQEQEAKLRATQQRQAQQRLDQEQQRADAAAKKDFTTQQVHDAATKAYGQIKDGNAEAVLSLLPPEARVMAEGWLGDVQKAKQERDAQGIALGKQTAKFIQANGYDPVTSVTALKVLADVHPGAKDALEHASDPANFRKLIDHFATLGDKPEADFTLGEGQTRFDASGQQVATIAKPAVEPKTLEEALFAATKAKDGAEQRRILNAIAQKNAAGRAPAAQEPLVPIIGKDGQPVLVPRSQASGQRPASTREQGRPVTSGDAGDLANYQTSLDDLKTLRAALTESDNATGFTAQMTAAVPYLPSAAKNRQAVIDRVKQVIGKTLEGGVLRKEDEAKYEKILPTIKDPPSVAASKITGLEKAITLRNQRKIEALKDANYDTSQFETRRGQSAPTEDAAAKAAALLKKYGG